MVRVICSTFVSISDPLFAVVVLKRPGFDPMTKDHGSILQFQDISKPISTNIEFQNLSSSLRSK